MGDTIILSGNVKNAGSKIARDIATHLTEQPDKVINNIGITGQEQVMIKVKVAEIQREILKQLGIDWNTAFQVGKISAGLGMVNGFGSNGTHATGVVGSALGTGRLLTSGIGALPGFATSEAAQSYLGTLTNDVSYLQSLVSDGQAQIASIAEAAAGVGGSITTATQSIINGINNDIVAGKVRLLKKC